MRPQPGSTTGYHHWLKSSNESSKKYTILENVTMVWLVGSSIPRNSKCGLTKSGTRCGAWECVCLDSVFLFFEILSIYVDGPMQSQIHCSMKRWLRVTPGLLANSGHRGYREVGSHIRVSPALLTSSLIQRSQIFGRWFSPESRNEQRHRHCIYLL